MVKLPWSPQSVCEGKDLVHCPTTREDSTLLLLNLRSDNQSEPNSLNREKGIYFDFIVAVESCFCFLCSLSSLFFLFLHMQQPTVSSHSSHTYEWKHKGHFSVYFSSTPKKRIQVALWYRSPLKRTVSPTKKPSKSSVFQQHVCVITLCRLMLPC